jgi:hypothetical protein
MVAAVRRLVARPFLIAIVIVLLAEAAVRLAAPVLPRPLDWSDGTAQAKVDEMNSLKRHGGADVVFAGTSQMMLGVDPVQFQQNDPQHRSDFNAALGAGTPQLMERWLLDQVVPRLHPKVVVWGLSTLDFSQEKRNPALVAYNQARATRPGWLGALDRFGERHSRLLYYRPVLRVPGDDRLAVEAALGASNAATPLLGPAGQWLRYNAPSQLAVEAQRGTATSSNFGAVPIAAIERTVRRLVSEGVQVVLVDVPIPDASLSTAGANANHLAALARVRDLGVQLHIPVLDLSSGFHGRGLFIDLLHLSMVGRARLTTRLAASLPGLPAPS